MTTNTLIRITRHASALLALCLTLGLGAGPATAEPAAVAAPGSKALKPGKATLPTPEARAVLDRIDKAPEGIAGLHRGSKGLACQKCHAVSTANGASGAVGAITAPDDNQTVENRECVACHEGYPVMAELTAKKLTNKAINPHASHLGPEIACTSCHQGHQESKAYCLNCHTNFSMPMPGNRPAAR
jgi:hypothetical protein